MSIAHGRGDVQMPMEMTQNPVPGLRCWVATGKRRQMSFTAQTPKKTCYLANSNLQFEQIQFPAVNDSEPGAGVVAGRRGRLGREEAVQVTPTPKTGFRPFDAAPDIKLSEPQKGIDV